LHVLVMIKTSKRSLEWQDFTLGSPLRWGGWRRRKINETLPRWVVSTNSVGSLTIMETGGGRGGENCKTGEIVLVFYDPGAYSDWLWQE
jgi:hypothetical protein